ncbi:hypothetical protein TPY_0210 [Sulfobacillus acidophilus TPY]|uniref:Uncharacterized protein n=1 Tax=Sulfobacillus acidophilus (strain ATCC 700253 / DSM 10332 / NAL) TaxID=679936 RepID=G8TWB8_SULAD|nr:hypothetical protein TPY_0210 [Sulfobacillus acidophilus TPY]AEW03761.1 hypothetical protein Sulac_0189 [Sulfobacillus acidophilus DSM 10332]
MILKRRWRIRWRKLATLGIALYLGYWSVVSLGHLWTLWQSERALEAQIAVVQRQNRQLRQDVQSLKNPQTLKALIEGRQTLPNLSVNP